MIDVKTRILIETIRPTEYATSKGLEEIRKLSRRLQAQRNNKNDPEKIGWTKIAGR